MVTMNEQQFTYNLAPQWDITPGVRGLFFTCGQCRRRLHERHFGSYRGRGAAKWVQCNDCENQEKRNKKK